jgi:hypothetical protein
MKKRLSLSRIFKQRDKLFQTIRPYVGLQLSGDTVHDLVTDIYRVLPNYVSHDAVFESCRVLAGEELTKKAAAEFAWLLAGNIDLLIRGTPALPWTRQVSDEWVPVQVIQVDQTTRRNKPGFLFKCRALAGSFCPATFEQFLSRASCAAIAHIVGFSRAMPHTNSLYFTNLRFWALVEAVKSGEQPQFQQVDCATAMREHNRRILAVRTRSQPCPKDYQHLCEQCPVGYDTCKASIYAKNLEQRSCPNCNTLAYFDLTRSDELCLQCWKLKTLRHMSGA